MGGVSSGSDDHESPYCYTYGPDSAAWADDPNLPEPRAGGASAMLNEHTWWTTGGGNQGEYIFDTTIFRDGEFESYLQLPSATYYACMVKVDDDRMFFHDAFTTVPSTSIFTISTEELKGLGTLK